MKRPLENTADRDNRITVNGNDNEVDSSSNDSDVVSSNTSSSLGDDDGSISSTSSSSSDSLRSSLGSTTTGILLPKSRADGTQSFINQDTMAAAAAIMARDQSNRRRPILLGSNTDGTINVQLPTGTVIAVEATAFPEYNRVTASVASTETSTGSKRTAHPSDTDIARGDAAKQKHPPAMAQERVTSKATVEEIERAIPAAASCVFHIFDRRVNLDEHSGRPYDNYSLLRAWAQDDPYRYTEPAPDHPPTSSSSTSCVWPIATMREETALCWKGSSRLQPTPNTDTMSPSDRESVKESETKTTDCIDQIKTSSCSNASPTIEELRGLYIQQAKAIRKQKAPKFQRYDAEVIRRLRESDVDLEIAKLAMGKKTQRSRRD